MMQMDDGCFMLASIKFNSIKYDCPRCHGGTVPLPGPPWDTVRPLSKGSTETLLSTLESSRNSATNLFQSHVFSPRVPIAM